MTGTPHPRNSIAAPQRLEKEGAIAFRARIGITGHRCIEDSEEAALKIADRLEQIRDMFPRTHRTPVVFSLLSSLAEGADRLAVRVAFGMEPALDLELGVVLPLAVDDYLDDFDTDSSQREFLDLLDASAAWVELQQERSPERRERDAAYDRAGRYIVDHSDVLIAVWDGHESQGQGGTAEIVEYARQRGVPVLVVPAGSGDLPPREGVSFPGESRRRRAVKDAFRRIDSYNRISLRSDRVRERLGSERARLGRPLEGTSMHWRYMLVADWALPHLVRADRLAIFNQRFHRSLAWAIHLLAAFAVTAVAVQTVLSPNGSIWLIVEVFLVLVLLLAVATGRCARVHDRWIGYRSLAEAFRSALFFALSGGDDHRRVASAGVLGEPEEQWFQRAFSQAWRFCPAIELDSDDAAPLRSFLVEAWIDRQIAYHFHTAKRWGGLHSFCTWIMGSFAVATIVVALLHITNVGNGSWVVDALKFSALTLPAFGGAAAGLREYGQLRLHEQRSRRAVKGLRGLKDRLAVSGSLDSVRRLAADAQRVMVDETLDWYGVVEFQDVDIVI